MDGVRLECLLSTCSTCKSVGMSQYTWDLGEVVTRRWTYQTQHRGCLAMMFWTSMTSPLKKKYAARLLI